MDDYCDAPIILGSAQDQFEYRIYASNDPDFYVIVDAEDYSFLAQFLWSVHTYHQPSRLTPRRTQLYLRRSISDFFGPDRGKYESPITGKIVRNRQRIQRNLFLHFVVMLRKGDIPPDKHHCIVGHISNKSNDCRRSNLEWTTHSKNVQHGWDMRHVHGKSRSNV